MRWLKDDECPILLVICLLLPIIWVICLIFYIDVLILHIYKKIEMGMWKKIE